jgi:hypothetical protein
MDARNTAKGVGAFAAGGWSVATVCCPKCASTRDPPGKSIIISIVCNAPTFIFILVIGCRFSQKVTPQINIKTFACAQKND